MSAGRQVPPGPITAESIDLYLNTVCNLRCRTCFLGDNYFTLRQNMTAETVGNILQWARTIGVQDVAFLGGEPTLHPRLSEFLRIARASGITNSRLVTNGTVPFRRLIQTSTRELIDLVYISLDGASPETNDVIRGTGSFRNAIAAFDLLQRLTVPYVITFTVTRLSLQELPDIIALAEASGCSTLNIHWMSSMGRAADQALAVTPDEWMDVSRLIASYRPQRRTLVIECQAAYQPVTEPPPWSDRIDRNACLVRTLGNLQFMPDGRVYACGLLVDVPGMNGFEWRRDGLVRLDRVNELHICHDFTESGCPIRQSLRREPEVDPDRYIPICIYERHTSGA